MNSKLGVILDIVQIPFGSAVFTHGVHIVFAIQIHTLGGAYFAEVSDNAWVALKVVRI
jgi:hypothetical protein